MGSFEVVVDIEVYDTERNKWAQGKYLYHGIDDVYWCDTMNTLLEVIKQDLEKV